MKPLKIYHLLAKQFQLEPISGDRLNEMNFIRALDRFSTVFYNDNEVEDIKAKSFGSSKNSIAQPKEKCDLYYVRNNPEIFADLPSPKVAVAYPYNEEVFREADAVITFNNAWKEGLERYNDDAEMPAFFCGAYPEKIVAPKKVISFGQVLDSRFVDVPENFLLHRYKAKFGYGFTVGYFGRIEEESVPWDFVECIDELKKKIDNLSVIFAGSIRIDMPHKSIQNAGKIPFNEMPFATSACDVILGNEQCEANWAGSAKPMEAMACGVPIVLRRRPSREDQLGKDYPLFYEDKDHLMELMVRLRTEAGFYKEISESLKEASKQYYPDAMAKELESAIRDFIKEWEAANGTV